MIRILLKYIRSVQFYKKPALVQIMAWRKTSVTIISITDAFIYWLINASFGLDELKQFLSIEIQIY